VTKIVGDRKNQSKILVEEKKMKFIPKEYLSISCIDIGKTTGITSADDNSEKRTSSYAIFLYDGLDKNFMVVIWK
jgi:hypothetical protein